MKKTALIAAAILLAFSASVFAVEKETPSKEPGAQFEQRKAEHLKRLDGEITTAQEAKGCIQQAKNPEEVKVCMQKRMAAMQQLRGGMRKSPGAMEHPPAR
ncbi:MAG TPA: hypothetical protein VI702_06345 [Nitrospiria bacterium]